MQIQSSRKTRQATDRMIVHGKNNVLHLQARNAGWSVEAHVGDNDAPFLRQTKTGSERGSDRLYCCLNVDGLKVPILSETLVDNFDDLDRYCETQPFASATVAQDERIQTNYRTVHIH